MVGQVASAVIVALYFRPGFGTVLGMNRAPALPLTPEHRATLERWLRAGTTAHEVPSCF